jgi:hypothetical protein
MNGSAMPSCLDVPATIGVSLVDGWFALTAVLGLAGQAK